MSFVSSGLLAFSMSTDAFAVSLSKGAAMQKHKITEAMRIGALFGSVEASAPLLGWCVGLFAYSFAKEIDHWVAFVILCGVGLKFIYESFSEKEEEGKEDYKGNKKLYVLFLTAMATSIDSFAVGISFAFIDYNILVASLSIGMATFFMVTTGIMTGRYIGEKAGRYAERLGGVGLILIGTKILLQHLGIL